MTTTSTARTTAPEHEGWSRASNSIALRGSAQSQPAPADRRPAAERATATAGWHDLAQELAAPITDAGHRDRFDHVLELLLGPRGANAAHLRPVPATPDVVRHRIAGWALAHLAPANHPRHAEIIRRAHALLHA